MLCTKYGAENTSKKTLDSVQNIENKRSEIFPPPRSMVLKVVRGKILETLGLRRVLARLRFHFGTARERGQTPFQAKAWVLAHAGCALDQVVKDSMIISEITYASLCYRKWLGQIKEKSGGRYGRGFKLGISRPACSGSLGLRRLKSDLENRSIAVGAAG